MITIIPKYIEYGLYTEYLMAQSKSMFYLLQDCCDLSAIEERIGERSRMAKRSLAKVPRKPRAGKRRGRGASEIIQGFRAYPPH